jgi:hypothetical protein
LSFVSNREYEVRAQFLEENAALNSLLYGISREFSGDIGYLFATFPSLDNNIWLSYPQIEELIVKQLNGTVPIASQFARIPASVSIKRKPLGVMVELVFYFFSRQFRVRASSHQKKALSTCQLLGFTYCDFDPIGPEFFEASRYWGDLAGSFANSGKIGWIGMGLKPAQNNQYLPRVGMRIRNLKAVYSFLKSLRTRLKLWTRLKSELGDVELFGVLRAEYFRALFGAPALQAETLNLEFHDLLEHLDPNAILIPHENQLWERVLSLECSRRGISVVGALHTTPKFWDLRFFDFGEFSNLQPDFFVDNGRLSRELLSLGKIKDSKILKGGALRFGHLKNSQKPSRPAVSNSLEWKTLVITGTNKDSARELVSTTLSLQSLSRSSLSFRPHPSMTSWFSRKFPGQKIDARPLNSLLGEYDLFITEAMSSMTLELAASGARVCVFLPKSKLNFNSLASVSGFTSYFHNDASMSKLLKEDPENIDISELLALGESRKYWQRIIDRLVNHG